VRKLLIPSSVKLIGRKCFDECKSLCEITFESGSKLQRIEKYAFNQSGVKMIRIPSSVEFIGEYCFSGDVYRSGSLCEITFESGSQLRRIDDRAFRNTGLKRIRIPSSVEFIGEYCFCECKSLCEITFEGSVKNIGEGAFKDCPVMCVKVMVGINTNFE
jgi:hypothetical protein